MLLAAAAPRSAYADPAADTTDTPGPDAGIPDPLRPDDAVQPDPARSLRLEEILRGPLDTLLREACSLDQLLERPDERRPLTDQDARQARRHADNLVAAAREMSTLVTDLPRLARRRSTPDGKRQIFDLLKLVRSVFTDVGDALQKGELGLSWYIAPTWAACIKATGNDCASCWPCCWKTRPAPPIGARSACACAAPT